MSSVLSEVHPAATVYRAIGTHDVPWTYGDVDAEYSTLRNGQGVIDLSSCQLIEVRGNATELLQRTLARDVEYLSADRCMVSLVLDDAGLPVDIVVVYGRDDGALIESSFGNGERLLAHLRSHAPDGVELVVRDDLVTIGLEGPYAWGVVGRLIDQELTALPFEAVADTTWQEADIVLARSGFTGEYGYKIIADADTAREFWRQAVDIAPPIGQQALELGMLEVRQPLLYQEASGQGVKTLGYNWLVDSSKESFVGRDALFSDATPDSGLGTVGFLCDALPVAGAPVSADGEQIGCVVHAVHSLALGRTLGLARVQVEFAAAGIELTATSDDGVEHVIETVSSPYIVPKSWGVPII